MKTGRYRVRRGFGNSCVLQYECDELGLPSLIDGHMNAFHRRVWVDVKFDSLGDIRFVPVEKVREEEANG